MRIVATAQRNDLVVLVLFTRVTARNAFCLATLLSTAQSGQLTDLEGSLEQSLYHLPILDPTL
jgi:hypothetical protein